MGFGLIDAGAAFELAKNWTRLPQMKTEVYKNTSSFTTMPRAVLHNCDLKVQGSQIKFIESVIVDLEIERTEELELSYWTLSLMAPDGKEGFIYKRLDDFRENVTIEKDLKKLRFSLNTFLGNDKVDGTWSLKLQIKDDEPNNGDILEIKNWTITLRGH